MEETMGKSKSVQQMYKESEEFRKHIENVETRLKEQLGDDQARLITTAENFYHNSERSWSNSLYLLGAQSDFETVSSWSLENVANIISKISDAVIGTVVGEETELPAGTDVSPDVNEITKKGDLTKDTRLLIASNCFNLLQGIVNSFGSVSTIQEKYAESSIPIGQGLRIFAMVACNVSRESSFFRKEILSSYRFAYRVYYSLDEFREQAERTLVAQYERTLTAYNIASERNLEQFSDGTIQLEQYTANAKMLETLTLDVIEKIEDLKKKDGDFEGIKALYENHANFIRRLRIQHGTKRHVTERLDNMLMRLSDRNIVDQLITAAIVYAGGVVVNTLKNLLTAWITQRVAGEDFELVEITITATGMNFLYRRRAALPHANAELAGTDLRAEAYKVTDEALAHFKKEKQIESYKIAR